MLDRCHAPAVLSSRALKPTAPISIRRGFVLMIVLMCFFGPSQLAGEAPSPAAVDSSPETPWLERTRYDMPFADRAEWLSFMGQGDTIDTTALAEAYPEEEFSGLLDGSLATVERVSFRSGPLVLRGILVRPPGVGPFPAVVYARGGNREYGRLLFLDVARMFAIARTGRVVLAFEYRGEGGSEGEPVLAAGDIDDLLAAADALEAWPDADGDRLALVGWSRGGLVAAWALTRSTRFDAAVLIAPSLDLEAGAARRPALDAAIYAKSVPGYAEDRSAALRKASPIHAVEKMADTPLLILHGTDDVRVHASESLELSRRLLDSGHRHRLLIIEGGSHSLTDQAPGVRHEIDGWLKTYASSP